MAMPTVTTSYEEYSTLRKFRKDVIDCFTREKDEDVGSIFILSLNRLHAVLSETIKYAVWVETANPVILFHDDGVSMLDPDARYEVVDHADDM